MFDTGQEPEIEPKVSTVEARTLSLLSKASQDLLNKNKPAPRPGPSPIKANPETSPSGSQAIKRVQSGTVSTQSGALADPTRKASIPETVVSKALALMASTKKAQDTKTVYRSPSGKLLHQPKRATKVTENTDPDARAPGSLGKMLPPQEQPPVAQHLNLARPPSTVPGTPSLETASVEEDHPGTLANRPGSTTMLHAQIRSLQRQLEVKAEESNQLRRQLEAQEGTDIGTLSEQLREAKREVSMWRERAEAAERRVQVFEKFTAKLRGIREAAAVAEQQETKASQCQTSPDSRSSCEEDSNDKNISPAQHIRFVQGSRVENSNETCGSGGSGHTEDAGVVTARIRKCLHGGPTGIDGADNNFLPSRVGPLRPLDTESRQISRTSRRDVSESAMKMWIAAQDLLSTQDSDSQGTARSLTRGLEGTAAQLT
ncbi:hypothetical protein CC79DRAFT_1401439 [Sarocladium strictum]